MSSVLEYMPPPARGRDEVYDTLDDFPEESLYCVEALHRSLIAPVSKAVGAVISGQCVLADPSDGYWGRALRMLTGEHIQVRVCPRGVADKPIENGETRVIAVRRTRSGLSTPQVAFAVLFLPESCVAMDFQTPMSSARTIGCRGVQLLLPSLFGKHDPHRDCTKGHADIDLGGFHTVRPTTLAVTKHTQGSKGSGTFSLSVSPGESYLVIAGHMLGVDVPDPLSRSAITVTDLEHRKRMAGLARMITRGAGEEEASLYVSSALTVVDLLGAEGIIGMLCHHFFQGVLPDMLHSPIGVVLCLVMASRIASFPDRFGLPACTKQDAYANREVSTIFQSRWEPVMTNGYRAIDVAIKSGKDNASARSGHDKHMLPFIDDNLTFWQRVGQRVNSKIMSDPHDNRRSEEAAKRFDTRFGKAEIVYDPVTEAKYAFLARDNVATPVREAPIRQVCFAPRADMRTTFQRMYDTVEKWLRTGMYGSTRLSKPNVNIGSAAGASTDTADGACPCGAEKDKCDCILSSSSDDEDDEDDVLDNKLCKEAMESSAGAISIALLHGAFIVHQFGIETFVVGPVCQNSCADCDAEVGVLEGVLLKSRLGECPRCNRRRCYACASKAAQTMQVPTHCKRCVPSAEHPRKKIVPKKASKAGGYQRW